MNLHVETGSYLLFWKTSLYFDTGQHGHHGSTFGVVVFIRHWHLSVANKNKQNYVKEVCCGFSSSAARVPQFHSFSGESSCTKIMATITPESACTKNNAQSGCNKLPKFDQLPHNQKVKMNLVSFVLFFMTNFAKQNNPHTTIMCLLVITLGVQF